MEPYCADLPEPFLHIDGKEYDGVGAHSFNSDFVFDLGEFYFDIFEPDKDLNDVINNAQLYLKDRMIRMEAKDAEYTSDGMKIQIIPSD